MSKSYRAALPPLNDADLEGELARHRRMHLTADKLAAWMAPLTAGMNVCDEIVYQGVGAARFHRALKGNRVLEVRRWGPVPFS